MRMTKRFFLLALLAAAATIGTACSEKLPGDYVGSLDLNRSASVTVAAAQGTAKVKRFSGGQHSDGVSVIIAKQGTRYNVQLPGCEFYADRDRDGLTVAPDQSCKVDLDGNTVEFTLSGSVQLSPDDGLKLTLDGAAATPGTAGGMSWTFTGKKQR